MLADFGVKTIGKIKRKRAFWQVDDISFWGIDKDFVGEEVEAKFLDIDLFAGAKFGSGFLELGNPEEVSREVLDFTSFVVFCELLLVVVEASS